MGKSGGSKPSRGGGKFSSRDGAKPKRGARFERDGDKPRNRPGRREREEARAKNGDRPRAKYGPWAPSAYLPSTMLDAKGRKLTVSVKPKGTPKAAKPTSVEEFQGSAGAEAKPDDSGKERLQKVLARVGVASRRKAEELILEAL